MSKATAVKRSVPALAVLALLLVAVLLPARGNFPFNGVLVACSGYGYPPPAPSVTGVSPNSGSINGGTTVSITGSGFCNATAVNFGTTAATSFTVRSDTLISAISPAHAAGTVDVTVTTPVGTSATNPKDQFTFTTTVGVPMQACSNAQYTLTGSDGSTWVVMDSTFLSLTFTPTVDSFAILGGNADLWTSSAGFNQDLGLMVSGTGFPTTTGQPEAWKESGGSFTFSPNAAFTQTVISVTAATTYNVKLVWKANHADSGSIWAGAGPAGGKFSTTCVDVRLVDQSLASVVAKSITTQRTLTGSDGSTWADVDATNLSLTYTPAADGVVMLSGNADLWTSTAGFNQDLGLKVSGGAYPTTANQPEAWKESGGSATFAPNAAYVNTTFAVSGGVAYTAKLGWKANHADSGTIYTGAGPIGGKFSPTKLTWLFLPTGSTPIDKVSTLQYQLNGNDGMTWTPMDFSRFTITFTPTNDCEVVLGVNVDLWTTQPGVNQDVGISMNNGSTPTVVGQPEEWKESGGFTAYSPNAAFGQIHEALQGGHSYAFQLVWKANQPAAGGVFAGAGPIAGKFSPTRLTLQPIGC